MLASLLVLLVGVLAVVTTLALRPDVGGRVRRRLRPRPRDLRTRVALALGQARITLPSGQVFMAGHVQLRLSEETALLLVPDGDLEVLARDAALVYARIARNEGWGLASDLSLSIVLDDTLGRGVLPPALVLPRRPDDGDVDIVVDHVDGFGPRDALTRPRPQSVRVHTPLIPDATDDNPAPTRRFGPVTVEVEERTRLRVRGLALQDPDGRLCVVDAATTPAESVVLGRGAQADVRFADPGVSRRHATLSPEGRGGWVLRDLGSSQGTWLNGKPVDDAGAPVGPGDTVRLGDLTLQVRAAP